MSNKAQNEHVAIFGAGIGGLTAAHELIKRGYRVDVYEKRPLAGGLARSEGKAGTARDGRRGAPGELGWRVYGGRYLNLLEVLAEIPLGGGRSVRDNLVPIDTYIYPRDNGDLLVLNPNKHGRLAYYRALLDLLAPLGLAEIGWTAAAVLLGTLLSSERIDSLDDLRWFDFLRADERTPEFRKYLVKTMGPYYGMDPHKMSTTSGMRLADWLVHYAFSPTLFYMMNAPTNEAWFDPWVEHLRAQGVRFHFSTRLASFACSDGRITGATIESSSGERTPIRADHYVSALPVEAMAAVRASSPGLATAPSLARLPTLAERGKQHILCLQYFFEQRIVLPDPHAVIHLLDTPWAIIIEPEGGLWDYRLGDYADGRIRDVWSVGPCDEDTPGILYGKTLKECTPEEIERECWAQLMACRGLVDKLRAEDGRTLAEVGYRDCYVWPTIGAPGRPMAPEEPKFSNNIGTLALRPRAETEIENLFLSAGYAWTPSSIYSMETACESGRLAANAVIARTRRAVPRISLRQHGRVFEKVLGPLRALDAALFRRGLPHPGELLFGRVRSTTGAAPRAVANVPVNHANPEVSHASGIGSAPSSLAGCPHQPAPARGQPVS